MPSGRHEAVGVDTADRSAKALMMLIAGTWMVSMFLAGFLLG